MIKFGIKTSDCLGLQKVEQFPITLNRVADIKKIHKLDDYNCSNFEWLGWRFLINGRK